MAETAAHGRQDVINVISGAEIQTFEPAFGAPDRRLVHADGHDIELATLGGDVGGDPAAQRVFI